MPFGMISALWAWVASFFADKDVTPGGLGHWWDRKDRRQKSRLKASGRYMRGGHGVRYTDAQNARRTRKQQKAASLRWMREL